MDLTRVVFFRSAAGSPICSDLTMRRHPLPSRPVLSLAAAEAVASAAETDARNNDWAVSIAVVDGAGRLLLFRRMDGTPNASVEVAIRKAEHAANYRRPTAFHQQILAGGNAVVLGLPNVLPVEGGVPLDVDGQPVGAVGVSGASSEDDGRVAAAGAAALAAWLAP